MLWTTQTKIRFFHINNGNKTLYTQYATLPHNMRFIMTIGTMTALHPMYLLFSEWSKPRLTGSITVHSVQMQCGQWRWDEWYERSFTVGTDVAADCTVTACPEPRPKNCSPSVRTLVKDSLTRTATHRMMLGTGTVAKLHTQVAVSDSQPHPGAVIGRGTAGVGYGMDNRMTSGMHPLHSSRMACTHLACMHHMAEDHPEISGCRTRTLDWTMDRMTS